MVSTVRNRSPHRDSDLDSQERMEAAAGEESRSLLQQQQEGSNNNGGELNDMGVLDGDQAPASGTDDERQQFQETLSRLQNFACYLSHGLATLCAILVISWVHMLGGLSWKQGNSKLVFNWHPLLMILAFCFMTVATLAFRAPYKSSDRWTVKVVHGSAWAVAAIFAMVALVAVFKSHNDPVSGFIANLYSFHSWIGMAVIGLYVVQFLAGFFTFGWTLQSVTPSLKTKMVMVHSFLGPFIYIATTATILLGIQEKEGFIKCGYTVNKADVFPLAHIGEIPSVCLVSHSLGIVVLAISLCTLFTLHDFGGRHWEAADSISAL